MDGTIFWLILTLLTAVLTLTSGLQCFTCTSYHFDSPIPMLKNVYKNVNRRCNMSVENLVSCSSPGAGNITKCLTSTTMLQGTSEGMPISAIVVRRSCVEVSEGYMDGCTDSDHTGQAAALPPGFGIESSNITNCYCSGNSCNSEDGRSAVSYSNSSETPSSYPTVHPSSSSEVNYSLTTHDSYSEPTQEPNTSEIRCFTCTSYEIDSANPDVKETYKIINRKCNVTEENLVTCPSPRAENITKCLTSTTRMQAAVQGISVSVTVISRSCSEVVAVDTDGCTDQTLAGQTPALPPGLTFESSNITNCFCSWDKCNINDDSFMAVNLNTSSTTLKTMTSDPWSRATTNYPPSTGLSTAQPGTVGLRCFSCISYHFDSPNPSLKNTYKSVNRKCNISEENLVTCPSPRAGNIAKCYMSTSKMQATTQGIPITATVTHRSCLEVASTNLDGCTDSDPTGRTAALPPGLTLESSNSTNCFCSVDRCNRRRDDPSFIRNTNSSTTTSAVPTTVSSSSFRTETTPSSSSSHVHFSLTTTHIYSPMVAPTTTYSPTEQSKAPGLRCFSCITYHFDSPNQMLKNVYKSVNRKCDISEENLVTCPRPRAGNIAKCYMSTSKMQATTQGIPITATVTHRSCLEVASTNLDGCTDSDPTGRTAALPPGLTLESSNSTNCFCSVDRCNRRIDDPSFMWNTNSSTTTSAMPTTVSSSSFRTETTPSSSSSHVHSSLTTTHIYTPAFASTTAYPPTKQLDLPGLQCFQCTSYLFDSPSPTLKEVYKSMDLKCDVSEENVVTCPSPRPGNIAKCYIVLSHVRASRQGVPISAMISVAGCVETVEGEIDGCKDGPPTGQKAALHPGMRIAGLTVMSSNFTSCYCSEDRCNTARYQSLTRITSEPTTAEQAGLRCFKCTSYHFDSPNPTLKDLYKDINRKCNMSERNLVTCSNPRAGNVAKCYTSTSKVYAMGLRCFKCTSYHFDSPNPTLKDLYKDINRKCNMSERNLVTCSNPRAGNVAKCYTSTSKVYAMDRGRQIHGMVVQRGCVEVTEGNKDGCRDGDSLTGQPTALSLDISSINVTYCYCSGDRCNNRDGFKSASVSNGQNKGQPAAVILITGLLLTLAL